MQCAALLAMILFVPLAIGQSAELPGLPDPKYELKGEALIRALKAGGYTVLMRHAAREPDVTERVDRIVTADCGTQIPLANIGRAQSRSIGEALRKLGIPLGEVIASPFCRTMDTARLIAGRVRAENAVAGRNPERPAEPISFARLAEIVGTTPAPGTNRLIVGHVNGFAGVAGSPYLLEGEAGIFHAVEGRNVLVARLRAEDWHGFAAPANAAPAAQRTSAPDALLALRGQPLATTLRFGGYTLYLRHGAPYPSRQDVTSSNAGNCTAEGNLSEAGRAQARKIGEAIAAMRLQVAEVNASPHCHAMETARLIAGQVTTGNALHGAARADSAIDSAALETMLAKPAAAFSLRIIVGDGDRFAAVAGPPQLQEGEMAVLRATDAGGWVVLARVRATEWDGLLAAAGIAPAKGN